MMTLNVQSLNLTQQQFFDLCQVNSDLRLELTAHHEMIIMLPVGALTSIQNASISAQLWLWNKQANLGVAFDSSTGFILPNGAVRSPDGSWIPQARWDALSKYEQEHFAPLCPDFVLELCSPSDTLQTIREKMQEYKQHGARLGWLIDTQTRQIEIYRTERAVEILDNPAHLSGEDVLTGFLLNMEAVWSDD